MVGCAKDPTFSRRRNLVTYAVDSLMESKSNDCYLSGVRILGTILELPIWDFTLSGQPDLIKELLTKSASCGYMIQALVKTMGTGSPDSREIREHAARIVAHVADAIPLRYFPGGIDLLSFLLSTVEDHSGPGGHCDRGIRCEHSSESGVQERLLGSISACLEGDGSWLVVQGMRIIQNLTATEDNCRIILRTEGITTKIAAPLKSEYLHRDHHEKWSEIAEELLKLMSRLMATPGEAGRKMRSELSGNNTEVISALKSITACPECEVLQIRRAIQILLDLDPSYIMDDDRTSSTKFTWILLHIFLVPDDCFDKIQGSQHWKNKSSDISRLAGEKLSALLFPKPELSALLQSHDKGSITSLSQSIGGVVEDLTAVLVDTGNISSRLRAAEILEHLCRHYNMDDERLKDLKKYMVDVMPKVLTEILHYQSKRELIQSTGGANNVEPSLPDINLESGDVSYGNAQENISSSIQHIHQQPQGRKLQEALISLCKRIWWEWYDEDPDLTSQLDGMAANISTVQGKRFKSYPRLLFEAHEALKKLRAEESPSVRASSSG